MDNFQKATAQLVEVATKKRHSPRPHTRQTKHGAVQVEPRGPTAGYQSTFDGYFFWKTHLKPERVAKIKEWLGSLSREQREFVDILRQEAVNDELYNRSEDA